MNYILALILASVVSCLCCLLGGALLWRADKAQGPGGADALLTGELILTGLAAAAHLAAVFTGQSFSRCLMLFLCFLAAAFFLAAAWRIVFLIKDPAVRQRREEGTSNGFFRRKRQGGQGRPRVGEIEDADRVEKILAGIFLTLAAAQLAYLLWNAGAYIQGDMTVETVESFLATDSIYGVNPMTGQAYTAGIPSRLKILCLPTLYGIFCRLSGLAPDIVVTAAVPVWIFVSCYGAFFCVGKCLFPESRKKRMCFMITVVILMWAGGSFPSMDGFNLLYCGGRGVAVRNLVFLPYLISLCLRKRWGRAVLCILAEACIVWTFYGLGVCALTAAGLFLAGRRQRDGGVS